MSHCTSVVVSKRKLKKTKIRRKRHSIDLLLTYKTTEAIRPANAPTAMNVIVPNRIPPVKRVKPKHDPLENQEG
jgi:hypothetical protein